MTIGEKHHGFILTSVEDVEELSLRAYRFTHVQSGAELLWLSCDDTNRAFCISFKTLPKDSTGVFHILEHSVLCGSKKFPLKEPFVDLMKGSMQTFLNAMTFPDKTMYPVASTNEKDFMNLMDVYMDAVLNPRIYTTEEIFLQEGWHLNSGNGEEKASFSGVVYNEMKGAYSSPDSVMYNALQSAMLPDTCYAYSSGGDPAHITDLTYEEFIATHRKFYHPENSYIYLYGSMDIEEKLAFLDEKYLSAFKKNGNTFDIGWQKPLGERVCKEYYEIGAEQGKSGNSMLAKSVSLCDFHQRKTLLGMRVLLSALTSSNEAPLKHAMMEAKLGDEFSAWVDDGIKQPYLTFRLKKTDPECLEQFNAVLCNTLQTLAEKGIDRTLLEASLNRMEFNLRELDFGVAPGVGLAMSVMDTWLYGGDPLDALRNRQILAELREGLDNGYFEKLIQRHLLSPEHSVTLILEPSLTLAQERLEKEHIKVTAYCDALGKSGMASNAKKLSKLEAFQSAEDSKEARDTLPHLERADIDEKIDVTPYRECTAGSVLTRLYDLPSNGISYLRLYFDISAFPREDWSYLSLLTDVLFDCPTAHYDALTYKNRVMLDMGALEASLEGYTKSGDVGHFSPYFTVFASFLEENYGKAKELIEEGIQRTVFTEEQLGKLLKQLLVAKEGELIRNGHSFASKRAGSGVNTSVAFENAVSGLAYYDFLREICKDLDSRLPDLCKKLTALLTEVINRRTLTSSLVSSPKYQAEYLSSPVSVPDREDVHAGDTAPAFEPEVLSEAVKIPGAVAYDALVGSYADAGYSYSGVMNVLSRIITLDYFWTNIRMRGGAYGCNCTVSTDGYLSFTSYRDPHVEKTYEVFRGTPDYLRSFDADDSELTKYVIGAFSVLDRPRRVWEQAHITDARIFSGITDEERQRNRSATLHVTRDDIRRAGDMVEKVISNASVCTVGAADKIDAAQHLFRTVRS